MKFPKLKKTVIYFALFGGAQFVILTLISMIVYPGGTLFSPDLTTYSFSRNFFSDLGRTETFSGVDNYLSCTLFTWALTIAGFSIGLFFVILPTLFKNKLAIVLAIVAGLLGAFSGYCFVETAWRPWDLDYPGHVKFVRIGFVTFLVSVILYGLAIFSDKFYPNKYGGVFAILSIIMAIQVVIMFYGPRPNASEWGLFLQAISQKIVVYSEILTLSYMAAGVLRQNFNGNGKENGNVNGNGNGGRELT